MANSSTNKVAIGNNVRFSLLAGVEKTLILPRSCKFVEIVNDDNLDIYFAVGDRIAGANTETRLLPSTAASGILKPFFSQNDNISELFVEVSLYCASNATVSFFNLSADSLI